MGLYGIGRNTSSPFMQLINTDMIAIEILKGISGSLGIILTVSIVALISSKIVTIKSEKLNFLSKIN